ncbi:MAG: hypothetical protein JW712_10410 [Dehalococcoidales bacterium]|nr:hypothetical protein [Dehalococcoidales bacterium]
MKKWFLVAAVLSTVLLSAGCSPKEIPPAAISEIYVLSDAEGVTEYVEIKDVSDRDDYCYIMIFIKSPLQEFTTLEEALPHAKSFTRTIIEDVVKILNTYDVNKDVNVWAQIPLKEGGVTILGHTDYDGKNYKDFVVYEYK